MKIRRHTTTASRLVVEHTIEGVPICHAASMVAEAMVDELTVHDDAQVIDCSCRHLSYKRLHFLIQGS